MNQLNPRFVRGQQIEFNPVSRKKFGNTPVWDVDNLSVPHQVYWLSRFDGNQIRKRALPFKDQRKYRVSGIPLEQQPEMWPGQQEKL